MEKNKLVKGITWNLISYIFLGIFSVCSYYMITWKYGNAALGSYNIVLSIFMLSGHLGVFGLQSAILYFIPKQQGDLKKLGYCFSSFLLIVIIVGTVVAGGINIYAEFIGRTIFDSDGVEIGLKVIMPAIILFSVNKFFAGYLNGLGSMKEFALLQGGRYFFIVSFIALTIVLERPFYDVFYSFNNAELGVFLLGIFFLRSKVRPEFPQLELINAGIRFGGKAMLGNVISDINTRIDIVMLGIFCSDAVVGTYSFISIIVEGVMAVLFVFRNNYNPYFSNLLYMKKTEELYTLFNSMKRKVRILFAAMETAIVIGYIMICLFFLDESYLVSIPALAIVLAGCFVMSPYFVAGNLCTLSGCPFIDTGITLVTIFSNIALNYSLIRQYQLIGAAMATGTSFVIFSLLLTRGLRKYVWHEKEIGGNDI